MTQGQVFDKRYWVVQDHQTGKFVVHGVCGYKSDPIATQADAVVLLIKVETAVKSMGW